MAVTLNHQDQVVPLTLTPEKMDSTSQVDHLGLQVDAVIVEKA